MNQHSAPFDGLDLDRRDIPDFNPNFPRAFGGTRIGEEAEGWTFNEFLSLWKVNGYKKELWWKFDKLGNIIGFESEGRKMFLGIAEIVISFHERKMFSGNLFRRIRIHPDLNVTHKSSPVKDEQAFENGGQRSDIDHFRWMVAAVVRKASPASSQMSFCFRLFFSEIFTVEEGVKYYFVSQLYHPIFFNSSDRCNLVRMMRDLYNLNPTIFKRHFTLESYGWSRWWLTITHCDDDALRGVLYFKSNYKCLYKQSNGFSLPLYIRNVHEHFFHEHSFPKGGHKDIDLKIDELFPGVSAVFVDSVIRNLHCYRNLFGSTPTTLPDLQRSPPYGWCFPYYRFCNRN